MVHKKQNKTNSQHSGPTDENRKIAGEANATAAVSRALEAHMDNVQVCKEGCKVLTNIVANNCIYTHIHTHSLKHAQILLFTFIHVCRVLSFFLYPFFSYLSR